MKYLAQSQFDHFLTYSSFGKRRLLDLGHSPDRVHVATNVADTSAHLQHADRLHVSATQARALLNIPEKFTVLFVGTLERNKRPGLILDLAKITTNTDYNFILLGDGTLLTCLRESVRREGLPNVYLPGRVSKELPLYYRAADVLLVPGRAGMVISEAMAWSLPVIVCEADGTEYDLVSNGETGIHLEKNSVIAFRESIERLRLRPREREEMGAAARQRLIGSFLTEHMTTNITRLVRSCHEAKKGRLSI